jgi:undecaprenyl-phosphate 4-deoxy-4-formamido-L-arabinose transferase
MSAPTHLSVVLPVHNERENLGELVERVTKTCQGLGGSYEVVFVDDGSTDDSLAILCRLAAADPHLRVVEFNRNYGQHRAVFAGMAESRGEVVITLDADLQNPPEEIPTLLAKIAEGYDVVGGRRAERQDSVLRKVPSWINNRLMSLATGVHLRDCGSMMRAYRREIVDQMLKCREIPRYIPALAHIFAGRIIEVEIGHAERTGGVSKYNLKSLLRLWLDLLTGFSALPLRVVSFFGLLTAMLGLAFSLVLIVRRLGHWDEPGEQGIFTLFGILFFLVGSQILCIGIVGEYVGRIFSEVRGRPSYVVRKVHGGSAGTAGNEEARP